MLALNIINHLLGQNTEVAQQLSGFNGIVLGIQSSNLKIVGRINQYGFLSSTSRTADTTLIIPPQALQYLLQGKIPNFNELAIEGDIELGINLMHCFSQIRYAPYQDLRNLLGEDTANQLTAKATKIGKTLQIIGQTLLFQATAVNQANPQTQKMHHALNECIDEINQLRDEVKSINQRLEQLENYLKSDNH